MANYDVTTAGASLEFDTQNYNTSSCCKIDDNHFIEFWGGLDTDGYVQVFTVNTSTWAVTTANASLEFDTVNGVSHSCFKIDDNHFINFWSGDGNDGFTQVFTVNTTTWAVTTANASLEFDTTSGSGNSCFIIDSNHFINFWNRTATGNFVQVFTVNTSTWTVTTANDVLKFDTITATVSGNNCFKVDTNHFINFWDGVDDDGFVQVFTVNTSTWAVTTAGASLEFDTVNGETNSCYQIDSTHFINFFEGSGDDGFAQVFTINTSTWEITGGTKLEFDTQLGSGNSCQQIDTNHFINFWYGGSGPTGYTQAFTVNTTTWEITTAAASLNFDTVLGSMHSCCKIDNSHYIDFWRGADSDGFVQVFAVELPSAGGPANLKTYNTNLKANIKTINTNAIANVKSLNTNT